MNCCSKDNQIKQDNNHSNHSCQHCDHKNDLDHSKDYHHHLDNQHHDHSHHMGGAEAGKDFLRRFLIVTFLLIPLFFFSKKGLGKYIQFGFATAIFYFALIFFEHAKHEIKSGKYGMMSLVSLATAAGYFFSVASTFLPALGGVGFYLEISTLIWVLLFGHYLEAKSTQAAGNALEEVAKLLPKKAHRLINPQSLENEELVYDEVEVERLRVGDFVFVKAGEKIPADGKIIDGSAYVNESLLTGESKPVERKKDDRVAGGAICIDGRLIVKIERVGEASTVGQIKALVEKASQTKPKIQRLADKAASFLTFTALLTAFLTIVVWSFIGGKSFVFALTLAITVLVIACPHALGLAIPTVSTIATSLAVNLGFFIKDMSKLEVIKDVGFVVFDKTGTLTEGRFEVIRFQTLNIRGVGDPIDSRFLLAVAASLEKGSTHPIATAILTKAKQEGVKTLNVVNYKVIPGKGVEGKIEGKRYFLGSINFAKERVKLEKKEEELLEKSTKEGKTTVVLFDRKRVLAVILLGDVIKNDSFLAIEKLHQLGVRTAMLTGDNRKVAEAVAKKLKIDRFFAEVKPEDKYKYIKQLQQKGVRVMMVGDGINDAPALVQADVGVAVGAGTDLAVEGGDVVLTRSNPKDIVVLIRLSQMVYRKMMENLFWAAGYNLIAIPTAAGVFLPWGIVLKPEWGVLLMSLSSVIVVINAFLLKVAAKKLE